MIEVISMTKPKDASNRQLREDIRELRRMEQEREEELDNRNARYDKSTDYPDSHVREKRSRHDPYSRTKAAVYTTGNRWAIENFEATHN